MMYGYGYGPGSAGVGTWMLLGMGLFGLMVLAGIVLIVLWAVRKPSSAHPGVTGMQTEQQRMDPALMIARERLAKGDISPEDYEKLVRALGA